MRYLSFDVTDGTDDILTLEAMASARGCMCMPCWPRSNRCWPGPRLNSADGGAVEDGYAWGPRTAGAERSWRLGDRDLELQRPAEFAQALQARFQKSKKLDARAASATPAG